MATKVEEGAPEGVAADWGADQTARDVVGRGVDAAPDARQTGLVGGVAIGGPLQGDVDAGAVFKNQKFVLVKSLEQKVSSIGIL